MGHTSYSLDHLDYEPKLAITIKILARQSQMTPTNPLKPIFCNITDLQGVIFPYLDYQI